MPIYLTPGTYAEELPASGRPARAIGTAVAGFVGLAPGGPVDTPMRITSWSEFALLFGDPVDPGAGPFLEGGFLAHAVYGFFANGGSVCWVVRVDEPTAEGVVGDVERRTGLGALEAVDEVTVLCCPDVAALAGGDAVVARLQAESSLIAHCEHAGNCIAVLDAPPDLLPHQALEWRMTETAYDSKFAVAYYPWIGVTDPLTHRSILVPPCGHVAGVWARTDARRGVHKAPANELVEGATHLGFGVTTAEQGMLNRVGLNCIRAFRGRGIRLWGARTLSSDPEARYLSVRRLVMHVAEAVTRGTEWATFEPNDARLWLQLRVAVASYLFGLWRDGALVGNRPAEAFFVKCDEDLNPPERVAAGEVVVEVGIAPVTPAEFLVFRISRLTGEMT